MTRYGSLPNSNAQECMCNVKKNTAGSEEKDTEEEKTHEQVNVNDSMNKVCTNK